MNGKYSPQMGKKFTMSTGLWFHSQKINICETTIIILPSTLLSYQALKEPHNVYREGVMLILQRK